MRPSGNTCSQEYFLDEYDEGAGNVSIPFVEYVR